MLVTIVSPFIQIPLFDKNSLTLTLCVKSSQILPASPHQNTSFCGL